MVIEYVLPWLLIAAVAVCAVVAMPVLGVLAIAAGLTAASKTNKGQ